MSKPTRNDLDCSIILNFLKSYSNQKYIFSQYPNTAYNSLIQSMQLVVFQSDAIIFNKGQIAEFFYIILKGEVVIFDNYQGAYKIISVLGPVNAFGEKAFENSIKFRTFGAKAIVETKCLQIDGHQYISNLSKLLIKQKTMLEDYIEKYIPGVKDLTKVQKERMSYHFFFQKCRKNEVVINQGVRCECLYFIVQGECILRGDWQQNIRHNLLVLGEGAFFGESSVFYGKPCMYSVVVKSNLCDLMAIRQSSLLKLPELVYRLLSKRAKTVYKYRSTCKFKSINFVVKKIVKMKKQKKVPISCGTLVIQPENFNDNIKFTINRLKKQEKKFSQQNSQRDKEQIEAAQFLASKFIDLPQKCKMNKNVALNSFHKRSKSQPRILSSIQSSLCISPFPCNTPLQNSILEKKYFP